MRPFVPPPPTLGEWVGEYQVVAKLGEGGGGIVFKVRKGTRFYAFADPISIEGMNVDFSGAFVCSNKEAENKAAIDGFLANPPYDKITPA